jgi:cation diffusion facilitator CzcD-associated flavoprotein CzcO
VPSHLYSFSFAPKHDWSRAFAPQWEIRDYLERCADEFDVRRHIRFGCDVVDAAWDEDGARWHVRARSGETFDASARRLRVADYVLRFRDARAAAGGRPEASPREPIARGA